MKISSGKGRMGSLSTIQCSGAPPSRLLVSKRPSGSTTAHPPSREETSVASCFPVAASQNLVVVSSLPVTTQRPLGEKATEVTVAVCPSRRLTSLPVATSLNRAVLSQLPVTANFPSGEKATESRTGGDPPGLATA